MPKVNISLSVAISLNPKAEITVGTQTFRSFKEWLAEGGGEEMAYAVVRSPFTPASEAIRALVEASDAIANELDDLFRKVFECGRHLGRKEMNGEFVPQPPLGYRLMMVRWESTIPTGDSYEDLHGRYFLCWPEVMAEEMEKAGEEFFGDPSDNVGLDRLKELPKEALIWDYEKFSWMNIQDHLTDLRGPYLDGGPWPNGTKCWPIRTDRTRSWPT